jgi:endonuclease YncB( thermonuclease family)
VVGITDGDTIRVLRDGRAVVVRLQGIDAPEKR